VVNRLAGGRSENTTRGKKHRGQNTLNCQDLKQKMEGTSWKGGGGDHWFHLTLPGPKREQRKAQARLYQITGKEQQSGEM